jgi:RimJ/RimL family protein N-acetyltransferase
MTEPTDAFETERLLLRPYEEGDLEALASVLSREDVHRFLYSHPRTLDEVRVILKQKISESSISGKGQKLARAAVLKSDGTYVGHITFGWKDNDHQQGEIGFLIHPDHQGHGYATEAGRALLAYGFEELRLHRIIGGLEARNTASATVMERLGMRKEAHLIENEYIKGEWQSEITYALLDREWFAANGKTTTSKGP